MAIFLDRMAKQARDNAFSDEFLRQIPGLPSNENGGPRLDTPAGQSFASELERIHELREANDKSVVPLDVSAQLIQSMAAAFNDDITVTQEPKINDNVIQHTINALGMDDRFLNLKPTPLPEPFCQRFHPRKL